MPDFQSADLSLILRWGSKFKGNNMPTPQKDEEKDSFITRCMGSPEMELEFPDQKQRFAVCNSMWDHKDEKKEGGQT